MRFNLVEIIEAVSGRVDRLTPSSFVDNVYIDSRKLQKNGLFIAIEGKRFDGHDFVIDAVKNGASALIISRDVPIIPKDVTVIRVKDTTKALGQIARFHRMRFDIPVIAVTGSAGKTTTKEMISSVLSRAVKVLKNINTENNQYGVALTLLRLNASYDVAVLELATSSVGEIDWLSSVAIPDIVVFTNIGASHLEGLSTPEGVFREKFSLISNMNPYGYVIFNNDDFYLRKIGDIRISQCKLSYACNASAVIKADDIRTDMASGIVFRVGGREFFIPKIGIHNVYNSLAAICCGKIFGIDQNLVADAISKFRPLSGRQFVKEIGGVTVIDDTYNSNPVSFLVAVKTLDELDVTGRKILACADMLELGEQSKYFHIQAGRQVAISSIDAVFAIGEHSKYIIDTIIRENTTINTFYTDNLQEFIYELNAYCKEGDVLLVKGSRGMHMERVIEDIERIRIFKDEKEVDYAL